MAKEIIELLADIDVDMIECLFRLSQRKLIKSDLSSVKIKISNSLQIIVLGPG